ncbi:MAG: hypothetical protein RL021_755 [Bacteroidota bacterium]
MRYLKSVFFLFFFLLCEGTGRAQTLIMNEVSNGSTGNQEYVEFVVVSNTVTYDCNSPVPPCIDIRGWIFDDNSGYHGNDGIALGAVRFSQDPIWSCVPLGTIIVLYNNGDRNPALPPDDLSLSDGNCTVIAPLNSTLFESNPTTPGAVACSYPATGWIPGGNWNNTVLANSGDCARIVNLAGCEVFSVCYGADTLNNLIYFSGTGGQRVFYFNDTDPLQQGNWTSGSASPSPGDQTPGAPNNPANAAYIGQFNNNCLPITPIVVTASAVASGCTCSGTATASASGSIPDYSYSWYDAAYVPIGQDSTVATGLCPGVYHVIATSHIGCPDTATVTVGSTGQVLLSTSNGSVCAGGAVNLSATPSLPGGQYSWTPGGSTTAVISVSPSVTTSYSCTYTLGACTSTSVSVVTVNPVPVVSIPPVTVCAGASAQLVPTVSVQGGSYFWSAGGQTTPTLTVSPAATSNYTLSYQVNGCTATSVGTVTVNQPPQVSLANATICAGSSVLLSPTVQPQGGTYTWQPGGQVSAILSVSPASTTSYSVSYTYGGCPATASATVSVTPLPTVNITGGAVCSGQPFTITASGATGYQWSTGASSNSITVNPSVTTTFSVIGSSNGCSSTDTATVTLLPLPIVTVPSVTICPGSAAMLTASGAANYWWSNGSTGTSVSVTPPATTTYTVIGNDGSCYDTAFATVTVSSALLITVNSASICPGQSASLTASGATSYSWSNGSVTSTITVSPSTTSSYTVTGFAGGCSASSITTVTVNPPPVINAIDFTGCPGVTAVLTANGASTWLWSNGSTTSSISVQPAITTAYTVTGTSSMGCTASATATAFVLPSPSVSVTSDTVCSGQSATLTASGASAYQWNSGSTSSVLTVSPVAPTTYMVIGTSNTCADTAYATVIVIPLPVVTVNSPSVCSGQSVVLSASGAADYQWSTGASGPSLTVTPAQSSGYTVTGTSSGCSSMAVSAVTVLPVPTVTVTQPVICSGQSATVSAAGAGAFSWSNGATGASISVAPGVTTSYTVTGTTNVCTSTAVATVTVNPLPALQVNPATVCPGSTAVLTASGATTYQWSNGFTGASISVTPAVTSNYTVTGTLAGCTTYAVATVSVSSVLSVDAGPSDTVCLGNSLQLNASPAVSGSVYSWSPSTGLSSASVADPIASPVATTAYLVTVTDANGCSGSDYVIIEVDPGVSLTATALAERCTGSGDGQATAVPSGGYAPYSYVWSTGSNTASADSLQPGSYSVTVTDAGGCVATASALVGSAFPLIIATGSISDALCAGSCDGTASVNASGGAGAYGYSWSSQPLQSGSIAVGLCPGSYTCTVTDANGCTSSTVAVIASPSVVSIDTLTGITACAGGSTSLSVIVSGGTGSYQYSWSPASGLSDTATANPIASPLTPTGYSVVVIDANGCASAPANLTVPAASSQPVVLSVLGDSTVCFGETVNLTAVASAGNGGPYSYAWHPSAGLSDTSLANPVASPASTTAYTVTVTDGCTSPQSLQFTVYVSLPPSLPVTASASSGCAPLCVTFSAGGSGISGLGYAWDFGDGSPVSQLSQPVHCFSDSGSYDITLGLTSMDGCQTDTVINGFVTVSSAPSADFNRAPDEISELLPVVVFTDRSTGDPAYWYWDFGDGSTSTEQDPVHQFPSDTAGRYNVLLVTATIYGCVDSVVLPVDVRAETSLYFPNSFTPNGDGTNDFFFGYGRGIKEYHLMIFDRWGDLIWETRNLHEGWDGRANGGVLQSQQDAFDWKVVFTDVYDRKRSYLGRVSIVK